MFLLFMSISFIHIRSNLFSFPVFGSRYLSFLLSLSASLTLCHLSHSLTHSLPPSPSFSLFNITGDEIVTTTADTEGTSCSWPNLEFEFAISGGSLAYTSLQCNLFYRARLTGDFKVGQVNLTLSSLSIAPMRSEISVFECLLDPSSPGYNNGESSPCGQSNNSGLKGRVIPKKVIDAAKRVEAEGRAGPRLVLSAKLKGSDGN